MAHPLWGPDDLQWLALELDLGKRDGLVFDGEALQEPHAFPEQEPMLLRALQSKQKFIERHVAGVLGHDPEEARPVAADQHGLTVRVRLGTVRLDFDSPQHDPEPSAYLEASAICRRPNHDELSHRVDPKATQSRPQNFGDRMAVVFAGEGGGCRRGFGDQTSRIPHGHSP